MGLTLRNCFKALADIAAEHSIAISSVALKGRIKGLSRLVKNCSYNGKLQGFEDFVGCCRYAENRGYEGL